MTDFKSFRAYTQHHHIEEELHHSLQHVLDHPSMASSSKLKFLTNNIRAALSRGDETGLQDAKPKKGSSRAVFFPKDEHKLTLDGVKTSMPSVVKVAFPGQLDKYNKSGKLLGEHQNLVEADHFTNQHYGMIRHDPHTGEYHTNHDFGVLAPMLGAHDEGHYIHHGRITPIGKGDFHRLTKTPEFPKGISHTEFHEALMHHHDLAHGRAYPSVYSDHLEKIQDHPLVDKFQRFVADTGQHPGDLSKRNMGIWKHPVTGKEHIVASDYGFNGDVAQHYEQARGDMYKAKYNRW
jgi:hypothetical protein